MSNHRITLINMSDGTVCGHRAGCADIKKQAKKLFTAEPWTFMVPSKAAARAEYNADFDEETDGWYDIKWLPCADHVPAEENVVVVPVEDGCKIVEAKQGKKWTYLYAADGSLIAELRNDQLAAIAAYLAN